MRLTEDEVKLATVVGKARHKKARRNGLTRTVAGKGYPGEPDDSEEALNKDINAAAAEMLVAKATNRYWHPDLHAQGRHEPDVGDDIQVRWTKYRTGRLMFWPDDYDDQCYFLVTGLVPNLTLRGYMMGHKCRRTEWLDSPNGRPKAYFVPQSELHEYEEE